MGALRVQVVTDAQEPVVGRGVVPRQVGVLGLHHAALVAQVNVRLGLAQVGRYLDHVQRGEEQLAFRNCPGRVQVALGAHRAMFPVGSQVEVRVQPVDHPQSVLVQGVDGGAVGTLDGP